MERDGSNRPGREDVLAFLEAQTGRRPVAWEEADLLAAYDLDGARAEGFMADFARSFGVDLAGYEAAFHHRDAALAARFGWPLPVPHRFGLRLPLGLSTLTDAAQSGVWPLRYPHLTPAPARDWVNWALVLVALPVAVALILWAFRAAF